MNEAPHLVARALSCHFDLSPPFLNRVIERKRHSVLKAVDGVEFVIPRAKTFALVGESGSGKSTIGKLVVGLQRPTSGSIEFDGIDVTRLVTRRARATIRGKMQMIFQNPYASLDSHWRASSIVAESIRASRSGEGSRVIDERVNDILVSVGLSRADGEKYPHEFSGGQRQRLAIARAIASDPEFLVCDEPTSALDVSIQAQILNLMKALQRDNGLTYLFISHNLAVVDYMADQVGVLYLGRLCEVGRPSEMFASPRHPYTRMLLDAIPDMSMRAAARLPIPGEVPSAISPPSGCSFHPRCPFANARCREERPRLAAMSADSSVACHAVEEGRLSKTR